MNTGGRYLLTKIDLFSCNPEDDVFPDDNYHILMHDDDLEKMIKVAIGGFYHENNEPESYEEWLELAPKRGYDFRIYMLGREIFRASTLLCSPLIHNALLLALKHHAGQKRKGDGHPYLEHPLAVAFMLWRQRFTAEIVAAGFCHDLLEDTDCSEKEILESCNAEVLRIVKAVTNDENLTDSKDWEEKKEKYIRDVRLGGETAIAVSIVDKISNLYSFFDQYEIEGPSIWKKFNRGKEKKLWFERSVLKMARAHWRHDMLNELENLLDKLEDTKE